MQLFLWIIDGLVVGWLTGKIMSGEEPDLLMDTIMGVAGGVAGEFSVNAAGLHFRGKMFHMNLAAVKLEKQQAPQKEIDREKSEADELELARPKNGKAFRF
jgi:uncharacterized membrane protein YeaQ/YmgE (transglycosylase-associated protein family)